MVTKLSGLISSFLKSSVFSGVLRAVLQHGEWNTWEGVRDQLQRGVVMFPASHLCPRLVFDEENLSDLEFSCSRVPDDLLAVLVELQSTCEP